jgi:hypothetical protein
MVSMSQPTLVMSPALYCGAVEEEEETKGLGVEAVPNAKEMPKKCQKQKNNNLCVGRALLVPASYLPPRLEPVGVSAEVLQE